VGLTSRSAGQGDVRKPPRSLPSRGKTASLNKVGLIIRNLNGEVDEASLRSELRNKQLINKTFAKEQTKQTKPAKIGHRTFSESELNGLKEKTPDLLNGHDVDSGDQPITWQGKKIAAKPQFLYYL